MEKEIKLKTKDNHIVYGTLNSHKNNKKLLIFEFFRKLLGFSQQMRARIRKDIHKKPAVSTAGCMRGFHHSSWINRKYKSKSYFYCIKIFPKPWC